MHPSRSSGKLERQLSQPQQTLTDQQLLQLILKAYEETHDLEQLQLKIKDTMIDDPERIRVAFRRVVEMKGRSRTPSEQRLDPPARPALPVVTLAMVAGRASQRRKSTPTPKGAKKGAVSCIVDASGLRESGGLASLKSEMSVLCRLQHQNLLNLVSFSPIKGGIRFAMEFDLVNMSHVTLVDMLQENADGRTLSLNGCEVACVLAQVCLGVIFLVDCAGPALEPAVEFNHGACLRTENIILTDRGFIKLSGHHTVLQLPRSSATSHQQPTPFFAASAAPDEYDQDPQGGADEPRALKRRPGLLAHRIAALLYELDHPTHRPLPSASRCTARERKLLDERYANLFSLCANWETNSPVDLRTVLYSDFINEQTSSVASFQSPLEIVFASRLG